jgi:hypothetical protein
MGCRRATTQRAHLRRGKFNRQVRRPTAIIAERDDKLRFRFDADKLRKLSCGDAAPNVIEARPARYTMKVGIDTRGRQLHEFIERPTLRIFDKAINIELPRREINFGRAVRV